MAGSSVSLSGDDAGALRGYWEKLFVGGTTTMLLQEQVWGDEFGICVAEFGRLVAGQHHPDAGVAAIRTHATAHTNHPVLGMTLTRSPR